MPDDEDRKAILARRNRLVALALSGLASASTGCYEAHVPGGAPPPVIDSGTEIDSGDPMPCLGRPLDDAGFDAGFDAAIFGPCLSAPAPEDGSVSDADVGDAAVGDADTDAAPTPCLTII